ncbi:MAG: hypothetical protein L3K07_03575 [Thermoplasmata archaeon]|nr:hypothetical protein [Thermoplasmata archaeon]
MQIPLGSEINLGLQTVALLLLWVGLWFALRTHREIASGAAPAPSERFHRELMTAAVLVSALGLLLWMLPNLLYGWYYTPSGLGYGQGGYQSYFEFAGVPLKHSSLLLAHIALGSVSAAFGLYLLLRMRWRRFPSWLAVRNFRAVMVFTWCVWAANVFVGYVVFYYFAYAQTG